MWRKARSKLGRPVFIYSNCMKRHSPEPEPRNLSGDEDGHPFSSRVVRQRLEVQEGGLMVVHTAVQVKCKRIYALSLSLSHTHIRTYCKQMIFMCESLSARVSMTLQVSVSMFMYISMFVSVSVSVFISLSLCMSESLSVSVYVLMCVRERDMCEKE